MNDKDTRFFGATPQNFTLKFGDGTVDSGFDLSFARHRTHDCIGFLSLMMGTLAGGFGGCHPIRQSGIPGM
jgi:hypothetical protein